MKKIFWISGIIYLFIFVSCEDVIEIDLNTVEPQIVIEARLYDQFYPATVIITKTNDFFDTLTVNTVSNAEVFISDNLGNKVRLLENDTTPGLYQADLFGEQGKSYALEVISEGQTYTSTAEMKPTLIIDSVKSVYHNAGIP